MRYPLAAALTALTLPAAAHAQMQPGQWEVTSNVVSADIPGAPPRAAEAMRKPHVMRSCVTPEQAARGPLAVTKESSNCRITRRAMGGGKMSAEMVCHQPGGGTMTATTSGSFTPVSFAMTTRMVMTGAQAMSVTSTATGKRVGACGK